MSLAHDLLLMGPVGTPLEDLAFGVNQDDVPQFRMKARDSKRYCDLSEDGWWTEDDGTQWSVEEIGGRVYTFALDDLWAEEPKR